MKARHLNNKTLKLKCKLQQKLLMRTKNLRPNKRTITTKIMTMKETVDFFVSKKVVEKSFKCEPKVMVYTSLTSRARKTPSRSR